MCQEDFVAIVQVVNTNIDGLVYYIYYYIILYSLPVKCVNNDNNNFSNLKVGVPIAEMIGQKGGTLLRVSL